jgi:hypothetical protein
MTSPEYPDFVDFIDSQHSLEESDEIAALHLATDDAMSFEEAYPAIDPEKASRLITNPFFIALASLRELDNDRAYMPIGRQELLNDAVGPASEALHQQLAQEEYTTGEIWSCLAVAQGNVQLPLPLREILKELGEDGSLAEASKHLPVPPGLKPRSAWEEARSRATGRLRFHPTNQPVKVGPLRIF